MRMIKLKQSVQFLAMGFLLCAFSALTPAAELNPAPAADKASGPSPDAVASVQAPPGVRPPDLVNAASAADALAEASGQKQQFTPLMVLAHYVRQTLRRNPQVFQMEAESRASEYRVGEARAGFRPRLTLSSNLALEQQTIETSSADNRFKQSLGQARLSIPLYDKTLTAQLDQRLASSVGSDWRLTDTREQLMLRTVEAYIELVRNTNLVKLAQENLKILRQYVAQIKDIANSDLGRASDLPAAVARVALAESVLTSRLGKLESARVTWRQLTGLTADQDLVNPPPVKLPETVDAMVAQAFEFNPVLQLAQAELQTARRGVDVAKAPYRPRVSAELLAKAGSDWGGVLGRQSSTYAGVSLEWMAFSGNAEHYSQQAALEGVFAAQASADRVRDELRARVEQTWFELQASNASLRSFEDYARNAQLMVDASKNQFKIGRRSLLEVLNAETELFTARSNIESTLQDLKIAAWRLHGLQGRIQAELGF
jgi:adhesin transport system outer membrane protein